MSHLRAMNDLTLPVSPSVVPGQQTHNGRAFPLVLECQSGAATLDRAVVWIAGNREDLVAQSAAHGVVLFRGFPIASVEEFDQFVAAFGLPNFSYDESLSNAVRVNRAPRVVTANEAPPSVDILLHHEMAQTPIFPSRLFFFCEKPAESGGATSLCRSDMLWDRLARECPAFARDCAQRGLRYTNVMPTTDDATSGMGRSWQSTLAAQTREEAERRLNMLGYHWEWQADGCLRATTPVLPAVRDLGNGRRSFFSQLIAAHHGWKDNRNDPARAITFGDGGPLDADAVASVARWADELTFDLAWRPGDVALIDNFVTMHGRRTFAGTRRVFASLVAPEEQNKAGAAAGHDDR
jgi:alpha-ketoglutarate-dependent taurine dioxygenase